MLLAKGGSNIRIFKDETSFYVYLSLVGSEMCIRDRVHGHELILKCSLIIIVNFISQT